jgi:cell division septation protein DedD
MSRVLKIVSIAVVIFLAYMWISVLTKSCNKPKEIEFQSQKETVKKDDEEFSNEDFFEETDTLTDKNIKEVIDYKTIDQTIKSSKENSAEVVKGKVENQLPAKPLTNKPEKKEEPKSPTVIKKEETPISKEETTSATGKYVVIAGNYLVEDNAETMVKKLKKAGFKAEKVVFNLSEFHTVIVGRYAENSSASKTVSNLKMKGFDAYVHKPK